MVTAAMKLKDAYSFENKIYKLLFKHKRISILCNIFSTLTLDEHAFLSLTKLPISQDFDKEKVRTILFCHLVLLAVKSNAH